MVPPDGLGLTLLLGMPMATIAIFLLRNAGDGVQLRPAAGDQLRGCGHRPGRDGLDAAPPRVRFASRIAAGYGVRATLSTPSR